MCGITGIISRSGRDVITEMTRALTHRGPDDEGYYDDGIIALGQRRLSIIDLAGGRQPIANEDESLQLVCNGEIYNSPVLRRELEQRGHIFRTATDVEVIVHLYEEYGRECVNKLQGMFALALWDVRERTLFLARDHMGQKPLFYCNLGDTFLFASEVKAIIASGKIRPRMDLDGLWHYVSLRFLPDNYSLFQGIEKLPAGNSLVRSADGRLSRNRYWCPDFRQKHTGSEEILTDQLDELLQETVSMHLLSDVEVGAFLSGGIDSSLITSLCARQSGSRIPVFSLGVKDQSFNELPYARKVVEKYGLEGHEQIIDPVLVHLVPDMVWHLDEPSDPFGFGVYLVSQLAAKRVKVALGGDGGDESFAGYDRYAGQRLVDHYCALPEWFRRKIMKRLITFIPESFGYNSLAQKALWVNEMSFFSKGGRYAQSMSHLRFTAEAKGRLFTDSARSRLQDPDSVDKILTHYDAENVDDLVDRMLFTDLMTRMPDHLLAIVDRLSMAHSLENRSPLVDYKVVEFAAAFPGDMKLKGRNLKYILKKVASRHLPPELIYRKKQGFSFPIGRWMRGPLRPVMTKMFNESRLVSQGIFCHDEVQRLWGEHRDGKVDHNYRLWIIFNLEIWHRLYFEGESPESLTRMIWKI